VDAIVSWEPFNTLVLERVPDSNVVLRGGGHLSYIMVATAHDPTLEERPQVVKSFIAGLAAASQYTRQHREEAVEIFARWVPNVDVAIAKKAIQHIRYDPRISRHAPEQFSPVFMAEVERAHPQYFSDLAPLPADAR
jgi:ABC-type nitrate/sulfonate/bicarbonate transport system substrate-binding protein